MLLIIEGNMGAGKTTLAQNLASEMQVKSFLEPLETNPYLEDFYKDPKKWALEMQLFLLAKRIYSQEQAYEYAMDTGHISILDRSILGDAVFAKQNWKIGNIDDRGYEMYQQHSLYHIEKMKNRNQLILFIDVSPQECHNRIINKRKRAYEASIPFDYVNGLDQCYRDLLGELKANSNSVMMLDWNNFGTTEYVMKTIRQFNKKSSLQSLTNNF